MSTSSWNACRSFLPEETLLSRRDANALWTKYRTRLPGGHLQRLMDLRDFSSDTSPHDNDTIYEKSKRLGLLTLENKGGISAAGWDGEHRIKMGSKRIIELHLDPGPLRVREDLAMAAKYVDTHERFEERKYVAGVTYAEMGRLFCTLGFNQMKITAAQEDYLYDCQAAHMTFCALNGLQDRQFAPAMIYMPREDFVSRFLPGVA